MNKYKYSQWETPIRLLYKGYGFTFWKWCGIYLPLTNLHLGNMRRIGFDLFHNGCGFIIDFLPLFKIEICTKGFNRKTIGRFYIQFGKKKTLWI